MQRTSETPTTQFQITQEITSGTNSTNLTIKIHNWKQGMSWKWDVPENEVCGICRNAFEGVCPTCKIPGDDCPLIWGECSHVFHLHCLLKWLETDSSKQQCPMDRLPWQTRCLSI